MPYNIYNLSEEDRGGEIFTYDPAPALVVTNNSGLGLNLPSGPTTSINAISAAVGGNTIAPTARFLSAASAGNALLVGRTVATSSPTVPLVVFGHVSAASAPVMEFIPGGGWVSITSVVLTTVSNFNGAIRIKVGTGYHWIPTLLDAGLVGTGAF